MRNVFISYWVQVKCFSIQGQHLFLGTANTSKCDKQSKTLHAVSDLKM